MKKKKEKLTETKPNKVKERRLELEKTQDWLAEQSGLSRIFISEIENNKRKNIGIESAKRIAKALGRFIEEIFP